VHVGDVDPLLDDSKRFVMRLRRANPNNTCGPWGRGGRGDSGGVGVGMAWDCVIVWGMGVRVTRALTSHFSSPPEIHIIKGVSHAYMHVPKFLKEGHEAVQLSAAWYKKMFGLGAGAGAGSGAAREGNGGGDCKTEDGCAVGCRVGTASRETAIKASM
jgi:hypothetical protein